jgi:hypothetical protein
MALVSDDIHCHSRPVNSYRADIDEDQEARPFEEWIKQTDELVNASAFAATVLLHEDSDLLPMAESDVWILYCALEDELNDTYGIREAELYMPAAAAFVTIAVDKIYDFCVREEETTASERVRGVLFKGESRLTVQRWQFWKGRFAEFSAMDGVGEECRKSAVEVVVSMTKVRERYHGV